MAESEIEVVRSVFAAFAERGTEGLLEHLDPEVEWRVRRDLPDAQVYRGHEGIRTLMSRFDEVVEEPYYEPAEVLDAGKRVVVLLRWGGRGRGSGVEFEEREETWVIEVEDGKVVRVEEYPNRAAAMAAAGISG